MGDYTVPIKPVSNWRLLARRAVEAGFVSATEYILHLALSLIDPGEKGRQEIHDEFNKRTMWKPEYVERGEN